MTKLARFKSRAAAHGQTVTLYPFSAWVSGSYVDDWSGEADPDDGAYPGTQPSTTYSTAVEVNGFFQPAGTHGRREEVVRAPWGEEVVVSAVFFAPGDQTITVRDKIVYDSETYYVVTLASWHDGSTAIQNEVRLTQSVPRA